MATGLVYELRDGVDVELALVVGELGSYQPGSTRGRGARQ
jgi:hypothetical protein